MRVAVLHLADPLSGGVFQYSLSVIDALKQNPTNELIVVSDESSSGQEEGEHPTVKGASDRRFARALRAIYLKAVDVFPLPLPLVVPFRLTRLGRWSRSPEGLRHVRPDLFVTPYPSMDGFRMRTPYVMVHHDLLHRRADVSTHSLKERLLRDFIYRRGAQHSLLTVVSSEGGRKELVDAYGVPEDKVRIVRPTVAPYIYERRNMPAAESRALLNRFDLSAPYVFYPARFWDHKNHLQLVHALQFIKERHGTEIPVVFVGSRNESFKSVLTLVRQLDMERQVLFLGYVSDEQLVALYKNAVALVMVTKFEGIGLPVLEAMMLGVCCLSSAIEPLMSQVGDSGLYFNPDNTEDIAKQIWRVWTDEQLRVELAARGKATAEARYAPAAFANAWREVIAEAGALLQQDPPGTRDLTPDRD